MECNKSFSFLISRQGRESESELASSRRSVSQGAVQKTVRSNKKKKRGERKQNLSPRFSLFFGRCFLRCALLTERLEEANREFE